MATPATITVPALCTAMQEVAIVEQPFRFTALPPELRNQIHEFALRHGDEGIISPACGAATATTIALINGEWQLGRLERCALSKGATLTVLKDEGLALSSRILHEEASRTIGRVDGEMEPSGDAQMNPQWQHLDRFQELATQAGPGPTHLRHICSSACLLQPPVTLVNSQLRAESLPLFYATNMFKIMLPDPPKVDSTLQLPLAMAFLRGIGDTHLRDMRLLSLQTISKDGLMEVTNVKGEHSGSFTRAEVRSKDRVLREFQSLISHPERIRIEQDVATRSQENAAFRQWMKEGGACVQIIERAVSLFNQRWEAHLQLPAGFTAEMKRLRKQGGPRASLSGDELQFKHRRR
ncbi:hypothetical protein LTR15_009015 [Elasticomyces elasticus]|nr:hypothetical protein LTR15_009015 [Elasticomyces elasticus]